MATMQSTMSACACPIAAGSYRRSSSAAALKPSMSASSSANRAFLGCSKGLRAASKGLTAGRSVRDVTTCAAKAVGMIKLAIDAGKASPAPPIGPALGAKGVNIMAFCKEYNARTQDKAGTVIPVEITVFDDKSFTFVLKTPPASVLLKKAAGVAKGSGNPQKERVGTITTAQLKEIAEIKLPDLNCNDVEAAMKVVGGTAANMGIAIEA
mmetsp:Transcript_8735/g.16501  ORF Transcript_8735/g.16501 Transcript_8735/m.16501 type:complete len:210 (-) Transcript_8735:174-803(-)|eukprot:CAMPEP_0114254678 /NCGR_PEP_ID=MMETSP0058-20121206/17130_1 /TAXON_ID=36894 /ORGANISM="Pyramimonas parkeae, CCMP726" /LENGTH=209 /DNA_ID=CAMNT_0001368959 /DNA_START=64 /DNA_END=693 /DNA_ORIENTATION=+